MFNPEREPNTGEEQEGGSDYGESYEQGIRRNEEGIHSTPEGEEILKGMARKARGEEPQDNRHDQGKEEEVVKITNEDIWRNKIERRADLIDLTRPIPISEEDPTSFPPGILRDLREEIFRLRAEGKGGMDIYRELSKFTYPDLYRGYDTKVQEVAKLYNKALNSLVRSKEVDTTE